MMIRQRMISLHGNNVKNAENALTFADGEGDGRSRLAAHGDYAAERANPVKTNSATTANIRSTSVVQPQKISSRRRPTPMVQSHIKCSMGSPKNKFGPIRQTRSVLLARKKRNVTGFKRNLSAQFELPIPVRWGNVLFTVTENPG